MASLHPRHRVTVMATIEFDEGELRALDAMIGYGTDEFIKAFYEKLGKSYMETHEKGLRRLFSTLKESIPVALSDVDRARDALDPRFIITKKLRGKP